MALVYEKVKDLEPPTYSYRLVFMTTGGDTATNFARCGFADKAT